MVNYAILQNECFNANFSCIPNYDNVYNGDFSAHSNILSIDWFKNDACENFDYNFQLSSYD